MGIRYKLVQGATSTPASEPTDELAAKVRLAELRVSCGEEHPEIKKALARLRELQRMTREEPNGATELREARAQLAELKVDNGEQHPLVRAAMDKVKILEGSDTPSSR